MNAKELQTHLLGALDQNHRRKAMIEDCKNEWLLEPNDKNTNFKIGDYVTYTNPYGIKFKNMRVVGFDKKGNIYINTECFWMPRTIEMLTRE